MKVRVVSGDNVTYSDDRRIYDGQQVRGRIRFKMGECYSVEWLAPKQYKGGFSFVSEKCLYVLLKKNDARWRKDVVHTPQSVAVAQTSSGT